MGMNNYIYRLDNKKIDTLKDLEEYLNIYGYDNFKTVCDWRKHDWLNMWFQKNVKPKEFNYDIFIFNPGKVAYDFAKFCGALVKLDGQVIKDNEVTCSDFFCALNYNKELKSKQDSLISSKNIPVEFIRDMQKEVIEALESFKKCLLYSSKNNTFIFEYDC